MVKETFGNASVETIRGILLRAVPQITAANLPDSRIKGWQKDWPEYSLQLGIQAAAGELRPKTTIEKDERAITVLYIETRDSYKENSVEHYVITDENEVIKIFDEGSPEMKWGNIYKIPVNISKKITEHEGVKTELSSYFRDDAEPIELVSKLEDEDVFARLESASTAVSELVDNKPAVVKVEIAGVYQIGKDEDSKPMYIKNGSEGEGFRMRVSAVQHIGAEKHWITVFYSPVKFGTEHRESFKNIFFPDAFTETIPHSMKNDGVMREYLYNTIIPVPRDTPTYMIGRPSIREATEEYKAQTVFNTNGMYRDIYQLDMGGEEAVPETPKVEDYGDTEVDMKKVTTIVEINPDINLALLNQLLKPNGMTATLEHLNAARKHHGLEEIEGDGE